MRIQTMKSIFKFILCTFKAIANEELTKAKLANDIEIARAKRDFDVKKAEYDTEVSTAQAEADLAFNLQVNLV